MERIKFSHVRKCAPQTVTGVCMREGASSGTRLSSQWRRPSLLLYIFIKFYDTSTVLWDDCPIAERQDKQIFISFGAEVEQK